ncbi:MAG: hypothetical protein A3I44_04605 [Candidatus Sungbacteria bacterium RIFCSPLOWO2_02_FULL_51_17]|uniref:CBS domain-containing protein n=1 Tax=Candidatus Sungbacteria bacterium RIFCSPHIGHO2_02_FULL_51_29 TaxID=1802273 RepID=A0A1G2KXN9_9BACT|nr:MAG: hypothetical protein A2676_05330 [Candidatus Sungbacteria bacterium RIFCSPHIGHO2_01_FULL_51_22]OHA03974.1 MAG: hypothetical protein A3C16_01100 [Candidatus Sungbacteria bacterium RIFCSPHIGHO2_02_FULL_51_29]OHA12450.1 MAG: hypothetical protein A3I44_04605 [Candidatus Sungbacteria bacterium RIFCSPLOWO2_02_FULL_51_17]
MEIIFVKDFMTREVITVAPETPVQEVVKTLFIRGLNGLPVKDKDGLLLGLITDYDFMAKGSPIYFSPLGRVIKELKDFRQDEGEIDKKIQEMLSGTAKDIMNTDPLTLSPNNSLQEAAELFLRHHRINPVPVVDGQGKIVGIISRSDFIKLYADPVFWSRFLVDHDHNDPPHAHMHREGGGKEHVQ